MNFGKMKRYTRVLLGDDPSGNGYYGNETMALFLNEGGNTVSAEIQSLRTFHNGVTSAYSTLLDGDSKKEGRYAIPMPFLSVKSVFVTVGGLTRQLKSLTHDDFILRYGVISPGPPYHYTVEFGATRNDAGSPPGDITFGPIPDLAYPFKITMYRPPTEIAATGEDEKVMEIPEPFHKVVCFCAAMELSIRNDDTSRARKFAELYERGLLRAQTAVARQDRIGDISTMRARPRSKSWTRRFR